MKAKNKGKTATYRISAKVKQELERIKKQGQSWDFLFEYLIECYWYRKDQLKAKPNLFKKKR